MLYPILHPKARDAVQNPMYTVEYYSAVKKNAFRSVLMRWMNLEAIIQSEVSKKEKQVSYTNAYIQNLERWYYEVICRAAKETQT